MNRTLPLMTPQQVADLLQVSIKTVYKKAGHWGGFYPGDLKSLRFKPEIIHAIMEGSWKGVALPVSARGPKIRPRVLPDQSRIQGRRSRPQERLKEETSKEIPSGFVQFSEEYLDYWRRRSEGDPQAKTFKEKMFVHKSFLAHLGQDLALSEITPVIIEAYLKTRPTNSNWNKHRKNLCAFFQWCFKRGLISQNPCLHVEAMPTKPRRKIIPSQDDILRLFVSAGELIGHFSWPFILWLPEWGRSIAYVGKILILTGAW